MNNNSISVVFADSSHAHYAQRICDLIYESALQRGTGIASRFKSSSTPLLPCYLQSIFCLIISNALSKGTHDAYRFFQIKLL